MSDTFGQCEECSNPISGGRYCHECVTSMDGMERPPIIDHPPHYTSHGSGVECITITEHMNFCLGNALKYIWRAGLKSNDATEDLKKARWYIDREISRLEGGNT